ncbi:MAG: tRNA threonylcarbamoyladenosine dehydratase [Ruminiclostridium sp.]|nr:tRNA threonylcarbamoyladenosine dehydratase [Ruminiclostridium sp.]
MNELYKRTSMLIGEEKVNILKKKTVAVFGVGGVGGYVAEALARVGIGHIVLIDKDEVSDSNRNRQIIALTSTIGRPKVEVMKERILDINPGARVTAKQCFFLPETADEFDFSDYDYVVDAVDTVTAKLLIIERCKQACVPVISSMGTGNKLDATAFRVADIYKTSVCPLARVMRRELKKRGIDSLKVVYSEEEPIATNQESEHGKPVPGSVSFVPSVAGLIIAGEVIKDITK